MKSKFKRLALLMGSASLIATFPANAANSFYAPGDLVLTFQQIGGSNTVYANLGNAANLYRGTASGIGGSSTQLNIINISSTLTSAFGAGWATDSTIFAGLAGVYGSSVTSTAVIDGDPNRTLYISSPRNSVGTVGIADSAGWDLTLSGNTAMTSASSGILSQNNAFENNYDAQATVSPTSVSLIDDQNPFLSLSPAIQGNAFNDTLEGGVQQQGAAGVFGDFGGSVGNVEFSLDLYRVLARGTGGSGTTAPLAGQVAGGLREGTFEGTFTVGSDGNVSFLIPEPSSTALIGIGAGVLVLRRRRRSA